MAASSDDRISRLPNFGVDGAIPDSLTRWLEQQHIREVLPSWSNPGIPWKFGPPPPDWKPLPPPPPSNGPSPFDQLPPATQPQSQAPRPQDAGRGEVLNWILRMLAAKGGAQASRRRSSGMAAGGDGDLMDRRPYVLPAPDPNADYLVPPRFASPQADALRKLRPEDLIQLMGRNSNRRRTVPPPIFFPIA